MQLFINELLGRRDISEKKLFFFQKVLLVLPGDKSENDLNRLGYRNSRYGYFFEGVQGVNVIEMYTATRFQIMYEAVCIHRTLISLRKV